MDSGANAVTIDEELSKNLNIISKQNKNNMACSFF
jgi:hypothetical protein